MEGSVPTRQTAKILGKSFVFAAIAALSAAPFALPADSWADSAAKRYEVTFNSEALDRLERLVKFGRGRFRREYRPGIDPLRRPSIHGPNARHIVSAEILSGMGFE